VLARHRRVKASEEDVVKQSADGTKWT